MGREKQKLGRVKVKNQTRRRNAAIAGKSEMGFTLMTEAETDDL